MKLEEYAELQGDAEFDDTRKPMGWVILVDLAGLVMCIAIMWLFICGVHALRLWMQ